MALAAPEPLLQKEQLALISWLAHRTAAASGGARPSPPPPPGKTGGPRRKRLVRAAPGRERSPGPAQQRLLRVLLEGPSWRKP